MLEPNFIILYVDNVATSTQFYTTLLGKPAIEASPTFAMFALSSGVMLGLWLRHTVVPSPITQAGAGELAFSVPQRQIVDLTYAEWTSRQLSIVQTPSEMDFGYTFVALDPDGHRLRVFAPSGE